MIKCKNCVNFKEHSENNYECLKIYNIAINDKDYKHECKLFIDKKSVFSLYNVNQQRELLLAFQRFAKEHSKGFFTIPDNTIDEFLSQ